MRRLALWFAAALIATPLAGQSLRLSGPPLMQRHAHVRDGVLIGATLGGFAGGIVGLGDQRVLCPSRVMFCRTPGGVALAMVGGIAIGGVGGGVLGGLAGAFIRTSGRNADLGLSVRF